jgi:hypothetical protein
MLAQLAHRMNVHEYMGLRIDGLSPVSYGLKMEYKKGIFDKKFRVNFVASLHQAFKSDFTYIISPTLEEFRYIISGKLKSVLRYFTQVGAKFRALDYALSYLPSKLVDSIVPCFYIPEEHPRLQAAFTVECSINNALEAEFVSVAHWPTLDATIYTIAKHTNLLEAAYHKTFKTYSVQGIQTSHSELPLHNLPVEIIEHIITIDDEIVESIRPLFCVSRQMNALKGKIKWRSYVKQFPLKYRMIEKSLTSSDAVFDWCSYYVKHNSYECNWRNGNIRQLEVLGQVCDMNDDILVVNEGFGREVKSEKRKIHRSPESIKRAAFGKNDDSDYRFCWLRWSEIEKGETINYYCLDEYSANARACIVNSPSTNVRVALATSRVFYLFEGMHEIARVGYTTEPHIKLSAPPLWSRGDRVFIRSYEIILDERLTYKRVFDVNGSVLDLNIFNGQRVCAEEVPSTIDAWSSERTKLFVRYKNNEMIGQVINMENVTMKRDFADFALAEKKAAFLDEFTIVTLCRTSNPGKLGIGYVDTRKLGEIYDEMSFHDSSVYFDAPNRRALGLSIRNIINVYDLNTKQWQTALPSTQQASINLSRGKVLHNSRYWCLDPSAYYQNTTIISDFGVSMEKRLQPEIISSGPFK